MTKKKAAPKKATKPEITAEVSFGAPSPAPNREPEPLIIPATSVPENVEPVAPVESKLVINIPAKGIGGLNGRYACQRCGYVTRHPDNCEACLRDGRI